MPGKVVRAPGDPGRRALGDIPGHETVIRFPKRMMQFFEEVSGGG